MPKERPTKTRILETLERRIAPLMAVDDGSIEMVRYIRKGGRVLVRFCGAYRGSPCRKALADYMVKPVLEETFIGIKVVEYVD